MNVLLFVRYIQRKLNSIKKLKFQHAVNAIPVAVHAQTLIPITVLHAMKVLVYKLIILAN